MGKGDPFVREVSPSKTNVFSAEANKLYIWKEFKIGNLQLDTDLHRGETRELTEQERTAIFHK